MLVDLTIKEFLAETASNAPAPGGGSISALNGAIATALTEMVANLTIGKKKYADVEGQMKTIATEAALVPMQVAEEIASVMETVIYVAHKGNRNAVTDACVAMMTARTCVLGALLNVRINLASIKDEAFVKQMKVKADHLESEAIRIETKLLDWVKTIV